MKNKKLKVSLAIALIAAALTGCETTRSYKSETDGVLGAAANGQIDSALITLEANNKGEDKDRDLLYFLEKGELLHAKNNIEASNKAWLSADARVRVWEDEVRTNPEKILGDIGSFIVNDKVRRYDGYDYEKVMLSTFLAVNHTLLGDWDKARVEIKKTHEREALIAEFRTKEYEQQETEAKEKNVRSSFKELRGYPVETLEDPEVMRLKNGYQSAFSHYLAGFVYEALGEPGLAAPGYRKAIELRPNIKILEDGLRGVDSRSSRVKPGETDVLFVVEAGTAPARQSMQIPLPFPWRNQIHYTQVSFPVIRPDKRVYVPHAIVINNRNVPVTGITSVDAMSRRVLRDEMPGIIVRSTIRAIAKGAAQKELSNQAGVLGAVVGVVTIAVTEQADERTWRLLPAHIAIARTSLPPGKHTLSIPTPTGSRQFEVSVGGKSTVVPIRLIGNSAYLLQPDVAKLVAAVPAKQEADPAAKTQPVAAPEPKKNKPRRTVKKVIKEQQS